MKSYADVDYYKDVFQGDFDGTTESLSRLLHFATLKIDELTFNRIINFDRLTDFQKESIKEACCFQVDFFNANGIDGSVANLTGFSVLDMSVSLDKNTTASKLNFSEMGYLLLKQTGLMSRRLC